MPQSRRSNESILLTRKHTTAPCSKQGHGFPRTASCCSISPTSSTSRRFALIDENGGCFVSRLKQNANPVITAELREWRGRAIPLEGKQLRTVLDDLDRKYIDVEVEVEFKRGPYNGTQSLDTKRFRVVGVRDEDADDYHLYMTNLARKGVLSGGFSGDLPLSVGS